MSSGDLAGWRPAGRVCIWRYAPMPRMYAGWHLSADADGCAALDGLFEAMRGLTQPDHRTLPVSDAVGVGVDRIFGGHELGVRQPAKLRLAFDPERTETNACAWDADDRFTLTLGPNSLASFQEAVANLARGQADFGIRLSGSDDAPLNTLRFWWWPKGR